MESEVRIPGLKSGSAIWYSTLSMFLIFFNMYYFLICYNEKRLITLSKCFFYPSQ